MAYISIDANDFASADVAVDKLINDYAKQPTLPDEIYNIAQKLGKAKQSARAIKLYQYVADTWPQSNNAINSRREIAYLSLDADDTETARKEIDGIINVFAGTNTLPAELYNIALRLGEKGLKVDAIKLHQYNADKFPKEAAAMRSQAQVVQLNIRDGNNAGAEAAYAKLLDTFKGRPTLPDEVVKVADAYLDANSFDKAQQVNQSVIDKWPKTTSAMNAQLGIVKVHFAKDDSANADSALDTLIADYKDTYLTELSQAVLDTGEAYWKKGLSYSIEIQIQYVRNKAMGMAVSSDENNKARRGGKAGAQYTKALAIWGKMLEQLPDSPRADWNHHLLAECYNHQGEYDKAIYHYQQVLDKYPDFVHAWIDQDKIIKIYQSMQVKGEITQAEAGILLEPAFKNILAKYPDCPIAKRARDWLDSYYGTSVRQNQERLKNMTPDEIVNFFNELRNKNKNQEMKK
jgi:TolA-binding protein